MFAQVAETELQALPYAAENYKLVVVLMKAYVVHHPITLESTCIGFVEAFLV